MAIKFDITADNKDFMRVAQQTEVAVDNISEAASRASDSFANMVTQAAALGGISLGVAGIKQFASKAFEVRSYFQDINSSMVAFLGNQEKADKFTQELKDYAWYNMFEFSDLAQASQQMIAYGVEAEKIIPTIDHLSDIAVATKANLGDLVAMYNKARSVGRVDSQSIQSWATHGLVIKEQLKEMGVEATTSSISFEQLEAVIEHATSEGGLFYQQQAKMMDNLSSSWGQLQDDMDSMFNEIGEALQPTFKAGIEYASELIDNYKEIGKELAGLIGAYGVYRAALAAGNAIDKTSMSLVYEAETQALREAIGVQQEKTNEDLLEMVRKGELSDSSYQRIAALREEMSTQEEAIQKDLDAAVARGSLTQAQAEEIAALREQFMIKQDIANVNLGLAEKELANTQYVLEAANDKLDAAKEELENLQDLLSATEAVGDAEQAEQTVKKISIAQEEVDNALQERDIALKNMQIAGERRHIASMEAETVAQQSANVAQQVSIRTMGLAKAAGLQLRNIINSITASLNANPIVLIATAVAALTYGIYKLATAESEEARARREANEAWEEFKTEQEEKKENINELISIVKDNTKTNLQRYKAYVSLLENLPKLQGKTLEEVQNMSSDEINGIVNEQEDNDTFETIEENYNNAAERLQRAKDNLAYVLNNPIIGAPASAQGVNVSNAAKEVEAATAELDEWNKKLQEEKRVRAEAEEEARPIEDRIADAEKERDAIKETYDWYNKLSLAFAQGDSDGVKNILGDVEEELNKAKAELDKHPMNVSFQTRVDKLQGIFDSLTQAAKDSTYGITMPDGSVGMSVPVKFSINLDVLNKDLNNVQEKLDGLNAKNNKDFVSLEEAYNNAKKNYEQALATVKKDEANKKKTDSEQYIKDKQALDDAEKTFKKYGGKIAKDATKDAYNLAKQQRELEELLKKNDKAIQEILDQQQRSYDAAVTNRMRNGAEKEKRMRDEAHQERLRQIEKQKVDMEKSVDDMFRAEWEKDPKNKNKLYDASKLTGEARKRYDAAMANVASAYNMSLNQENLDFDNINDVLDKFLSNSEQLAAEADKYTNDIERLTNARNAMLEAGNEAEAARLAGLVEYLTLLQSAAKVDKDQLEYDKTYGNYETKRSAISSDYESQIKIANASGNTALANSLRKQMESSLAQLDVEELSNVIDFEEMFKNAPEGLAQAMRKKRQSILTSLGLTNDASSKSIFDALYKKDKESGMSYYKEELEGILEDADKAQTGVGQLAASFKVFKKSKDYKDEAAQALKDGDAEKAKFLTELAENAATQGVQKVGNATAMIAGNLSQAAEFMKEIASISEDTSLDATADALGGIAQNFAAAGQGAASGGWIGAIVGGVTDIVSQTLSAVTASKAADAAMTQYLTNFRNELKLLDLQVQKEDYTSLFGAKNISMATDAYKKAAAAQSAYKQSIAKLGSMQVKTKDYTGLSQLFKDDEFKSLRQLAPQLWGEGGVFSTEKAEAFLASNNMLTDTQRQQIQNAIDLKKAYEDAQSVAEDYISSMVSSLSGDLTNAIFDSVRNGSNAWQSFQTAGSQVIDQLGKQMIQELYIQSYLDNFQDDMKSAFGASNPSEALARVMGDIMTGMPEIMNVASEAAQLWDTLAEENGFDMSNLDSSSASGTSGMQSSFTQDSVDEANGRMASLQMGQQTLILQGTAVLSAIEAMKSSAIDNYNVLSDIRQLEATRNGYLEDIIDIMSKMTNGLTSQIKRVADNTNNI